MVKYDYLIAGAGLFGAVFAQRAVEKGKTCLVIDRRGHIGGNCYTEKIDGIEVHKYGAHIFHTNSKAVWEYVNRFADFNRFTNSPMANYKGELFNLPFNMNTFLKAWGAAAPEQAKRILAEQTGGSFTPNPRNLEEQAINLVGPVIYEKLIKGYTEKQWGRPCTELPPDIIKRLPVRFTFDNNYFDAEFQGIPKDGYTAMIAEMLKGAETVLNADYLKDRDHWNRQADKTLYTGTIDAFYDYQFGALQYRSVRFETKTLQTDNYQGVAVMNFTDAQTPYTRIIEHKHFTPNTPAAALPHTVVSREYSAEWQAGGEPYYPINDGANTNTYAEYRALAQKEEHTLFGGRLAEYRYLDMDAVIERALLAAGAAGGF